MLLSLLFSAAAATCDVKALQTSFANASPASAGKVFAELAACDPVAAKAFAPTAFSRIIAGEAADAALVAAVAVGATGDVQTWISSREPDEKSAALKMLGGSCEKPGVPAFFTDSAKSLGDKFWSESWYTGLSTCRDAGVQELLRGVVMTPKVEARYFSVLSIFSRNLGKNAIPVIKTLLEQRTETELLVNLVSALSDAALSDVSAGDASARALAVSTILEVAPKLPVQAINQARITLIGLGAEAESDGLVAVRYSSVLQADKSLIYGAVILDVATCKKGDTKVEIHVVQVNDSGHTWPDQLLERVKTQTSGSIALDLGARCKGTSVPEYIVSTEPFKDVAAFQAWADEQVKAAEKKYAEVKPKRIDEPATKI